MDKYIVLPTVLGIGFIGVAAVATQIDSMEDGANPELVSLFTDISNASLIFIFAAIFFLGLTALLYSALTAWWR